MPILLRLLTHSAMPPLILGEVDGVWKSQHMTPSPGAQANEMVIDVRASWVGVGRGAPSHPPPEGYHMTAPR